MFSDKPVERVRVSAEQREELRRSTRGYLYGYASKLTMPVFP